MTLCFVFTHRQCNAQILGGVDNYALVCLDIVWCYLCLKQITDLPDAGKVYISAHL